MRINVTRETSLERKLWHFYYDERIHTLRLDTFEREIRPTTRHKFRREDRWGPTTYDRRAPGYLKEVPACPADVQDEALREFRDSLKLSVTGEW